MDKNEIDNEGKEAFKCFVEAFGSDDMINRIIAEEILRVILNIPDDKDDNGNSID